MPISYKFKTHSGEAVLLEQIDRELANALPDLHASCKYPSVYPLDGTESVAMFAIYAIGMASCKTGQFNEEDFVNACNINTCIPESVARKFINGDYIFSCWY